MEKIFRTYINKEQMAKELAADIAKQAQNAIAQRGVFSLFLAGGSSPRLLHKLLAKNEQSPSIDWSKVHLFWGDERVVAKEHKESNFGIACQDLVDEIAIPQDNVFPMVLARESGEEAAARYEKLLQDHLSHYSFFDLVILGVGTDGHTASLFPGTEALEVKGQLVTTGYAPESASIRERVTLTYEAFMKAQNVYFLVAGKGKAEVLKALKTDGEKAPYPSAKVRAKERLVFHVDGETLGER